MNQRSTDNSENRLPRENPFRTPEGYFESLEESLLGRIDSLPSTEKSDRPAPFRVPKGYFESLPEKVLDRIERGAKVVPIGSATVHRAWWMSAAAAMVCGLLLFGHLDRPIELSSASGEASISLEELQSSYIVDDLDESTLAEAISGATFSDAEIQDDEEIRQYLLDNENDFSQIDI